MVKLPDPLENYSKPATSLLKKGGIGEVEFSGATYQIQVIDPKSQEDYWAFLQFDQKNRLTDYFCSCEEEGSLGGCIHVAAAYLKVFEKGEVPLHIRFHESLWNHICFYFLEEYGDDPQQLKLCGEEEYEFIFNENKVFSAKGLTDKGKAHLKKIFLDRIVQTEETSLKFSNLSEDEIMQWREGRPSSHLKYELSFWNDLAKWQMMMQDAEGACTVHFDYGPHKLPNQLSVQFKDVSFFFILTTHCLQAIIPSLSTVHSSLTVYGKPDEVIEKVTYDKLKKEIIVQPKSLLEKEISLAESNLKQVLEDWIFLPEQGFFPVENHPLLEQKVYGQDEIGSLLNRYYSILKTKFQRVKIAEKSLPMSYKIYFDRDWVLHIEGYLLKPGDLQRPTSGYFGDWVYLEEEGFIHLDEIMFPAVETLIPESHVGGFVQQYRGWLNYQKGYQTHITGVETKLSFVLAENGSLKFSREASMEDESATSKDFGPWIYIKGEGFFSKSNTHLASPIRTGTTIKQEQIPLFIRMHQDELVLIKDFFSPRSPVAKVGLKVELTSFETVSITPGYELYPEYNGKTVLFFEDYTYVEGEGFCRIPSQMLLPERFNHPLTLEKANLPQFFAYEIDELKPYAFSIDPRLIPPEHLGIVADSLSLGTDGYQLEIHYVSDKNSIKLCDLWAAKQKNERFIFSDVGLIDLNEDRYQWLPKVKKEQIDFNQNRITLSTLELLRLSTFDPLKVLQGKELMDELQQFRTPEEPDLRSLKSHLRPYQEIGLRWLWFLFHHNLSGLLCDDMGLGKTHQAMALMAALSQKGKVHFLVVCPTSVIYHWEEKLKEFLPNVRVCTFHGSNRSLGDFHADYEVLLTSYGIWRKESELLSEVGFEVAIFDEIHAAKNQASRIHTSLLKVKARMRLGLTGTPIENKLLELKALFDIILPTYMPSDMEYRKLFVGPIQKENDRERKKLLSKLIKPFVLRRKKQDVLTDLPEKTEEISHCELSLDQKLLYNDVLHRVREGIYRELEDNKNSIPFIHIFSALSSLKQICNHPAAFLKIPHDFERYTSGKWDLFVELLSEALESGQKVVIFSQYLAMLDIIEKYLQDRNIRYASIRGATVKRGEEVRRFNKDPGCEVFIGTLQAAGTGIDLTAGSVVIHYDRWWNAAKENQATDRVHRIGQVRGVQVFKLVTKGTFEERIDEMISQKGKLMEDVVGVDDYRFMKQFDRQEIMQLFRDFGE